MFPDLFVLDFVQFFDYLVQVFFAGIQEPVSLEKVKVRHVFGVMDGRIILKMAGEILGELEVGAAVFGLDDDGKAAESAKGFFNSLIIGFDFFSVERVLQLNFPAKVFDGVD